MMAYIYTYIYIYIYIYTYAYIQTWWHTHFLISAESSPPSLSLSNCAISSWAPAPSKAESVSWSHPSSSCMYVGVCEHMLFIYVSIFRYTWICVLKLSLKRLHARRCMWAYVVYICIHIQIYVNLCLEAISQAPACICRCMREGKYMLFIYASQSLHNPADILFYVYL